MKYINIFLTTFPCYDMESDNIELGSDMTELGSDNIQLGPVSGIRSTSHTSNVGDAVMRFDNDGLEYVQHTCW